MAILDAGLTATLSREFARTDQTADEKRRTFRTLETSYLILVSIAIIVIFSLSDFIAHKWLNVATYGPDKLALFLKIISFDIGFQLLFRFYTGGLMGLEHQVKANILQVGWGMLRNGMVILPMIFYPDLTLFFIWQAVSTVLFTLFLRAALSKKLFDSFEIPKLRLEKEVLSRTWNFAGGMLLISLVAALNSQMDKLAISKLLSLENLGYYTLAVSLASGLVVLVNPISVAVLPRFTSLYTSGKNVEASQLFHKINKAVSILVYGIMGNLLFFGQELMWVWTGKMELAEKTTNILGILAVSYSMLAIAMLPYNIAIANGYTKLNNILGIVSLVVTLPGYWLFTEQYGAVGAAAVFCGVQTIITLIYLYFINKKFLQAKVYILYFRELFLPLFLSLIIVFALSFLPKFYTGDRWFTLIVIALSTFITFAITSVLLISKQERIFYFQLFNKKTL